MVTVRTAGLDEVHQVATFYAAANAEDPVLCWVIPDEEARLDITGGDIEKTGQFIGGMMRNGEVLIAQDDADRVVGVSLWESVEDDTTPQLNTTDFDVFIEQAYGDYAPRMKQLAELTGQRHPRGEPHLYLQQIVVDPKLRSRGIGSAILRHRLERSDAEGRAAYLEASTARNRALYQRHGFADLGDPIELPDNGPRLQPMWRKPA